MALGGLAGGSTPGQDLGAIAIGYYAATGGQGTGSIAIGWEAGASSFQGENSIAIGRNTRTNVGGAIAINAVGNLLSADNPGFYVNQLRENTNVSSNYGLTGGSFLGYDIKYNSGTKELDYRSNAYYRAYMSSSSLTLSTTASVVGGLSISLSEGVWLLNFDIRFGWLNSFIDGTFMTNFLYDQSNNLLKSSHRLICLATASGLGAVNGIQQSTASWH